MNTEIWWHGGMVTNTNSTQTHSHPYTLRRTLCKLFCILSLGNKAHYVFIIHRCGQDHQLKAKIFNAMCSTCCVQTLRQSVHGCLRQTPPGWQNYSSTPSIFIWWHPRSFTSLTVCVFVYSPRTSLRQMHYMSYAWMYVWACVCMCECVACVCVCDILPPLTASDTHPQGHKSGQVAIRKD